MMSTRRYELRLATRDGCRVLATRAEREVALTAESVMRRYGDDILDVGFSVAAPYPSTLVRGLDPALDRPSASEG